MRTSSLAPTPSVQRLERDRRERLAEVVSGHGFSRADIPQRVVIPNPALSGRERDPTMPVHPQSRLPRAPLQREQVRSLVERTRERKVCIRARLQPCRSACASNKTRPKGAAKMLPDSPPDCSNICPRISDVRVGRTFLSDNPDLINQEGTASAVPISFAFHIKRDRRERTPTNYNET
ncbi:MAG: hypothetical protein JWN74_3029 [Acidobacteriaceae bacterium]|nr:hypothetical protein [Acidobacteriaceae bacterium]